MDDIDFRKVQKRFHFIGIKVSGHEREMIDNFCKKNEISISDLVRESIKKVLSEKTVK